MTDLQRVLDSVMPAGTDRLDRAEMVKRISAVVQPGRVQFRDMALADGILHSLAYYAGVVRFDGNDVVRRDPVTQIPGRIGTGSKGTVAHMFDEDGTPVEVPQAELPSFIGRVRAARRARRLAALRADVEEATAV